MLRIVLHRVVDARCLTARCLRLTNFDVRAMRSSGRGQMRISVYQVPDVSCDHCVKAITEELSAKNVTVEHEGSVSDAQLRTGIEAAGYDIDA